MILIKGKGKTTELIKISAETDHRIVCKDIEEAIRIASLAKDMCLSIPYPITYYEFINRHYSSREIKGYLIDNADLFLQSLTNVPITHITMTIKVKEVTNTIPDRKQWFLDRIGKKVYRNRLPNESPETWELIKNGLIIENETGANYLYDVECEFNIEKECIRYFDTKEEAEEYEKMITKEKNKQNK